MQRFARRSALLLVLLLAPVTAWGEALNILLTNDDGWNAPGIQALRSALLAAGHHVTLVAPATDQSGKGGSLNANVLDFVPGVGLMALTNQGGDQFSLAGTPVDAVHAGLDIVLAGQRVDLIVSGLNRGQNLGRPASNTSGTIGAALVGTFGGIPAIAGSVGILLAESSAGFPSTLAAYPLAADFLVRSIDALVAANGLAILPKGVGMLNVNFPVPYDQLRGSRITALGAESDLDLPLYDPTQGFPPLGVPPLASFPSCAVALSTPGAFCYAAVGVVFPAGPDPVKKADTTAYRDLLISITPMDGDMTSGVAAANQVQRILRGVAP